MQIKGTDGAVHFDGVRPILLYFIEIIHPLIYTLLNQIKNIIAHRAISFQLDFVRTTNNQKRIRSILKFIAGENSIYIIVLPKII